MDSSEMKVKKGARTKKKAKQANVVAKTICTSPDNDCTPAANPVAGCKQNTDGLRRGVTYKGFVDESFEYRFIVLVEKRFRVLVHNARYLPLAKQRDVPIQCVLAKGDEVFLTAIKNNNMSRYDVEWLAEKCWVEQTDSKQSDAEDSPVLVASVTLVTESLLQLGAVVADSSSIFLHGFLVHGINLNDIFKIGDELSYEIDTSKPLSAKRAWYGSVAPSDSCDSTDKLLEFCLSQGIRKEIIISLSKQKQGKSTSRATKNLDDDEFLCDLKYIKLQVLDSRSEKGKKGSQDKYVAELRRKQHAATEAARKQTSKERYTLHVNEIQLGNRFEVLSSLIDSNCSETSEVIDVATQTYSSGDIFCDFDSYNFSQE